MKTPVILKLLFLFFSLNLFSQKYHSEIEKSIFEAFSKDSLDYPFIKSLCAIDSTLTEERFNNYLNVIQTEISKISPKEIKEKKEKKRIKNIYNTIHNRFFEKYEANSYFTDIFKNGNYNCVTATAIYVFIFDELNIPYHIKELPTHVYLIAYPKTYKIHLETTAPGEYGFIVPKDSEIKKMVDELVKMKLVSSSELNSKGYDQTYHDYYYGKEHVEKNSLIGMQYYNNSITNYNNNNLKVAQNNLSKSLVFHSTPISKLIYKELLRTNIAELSFNNEESIEILMAYFLQQEFKKDFDLNDVKYLLHKLTENDDNDFDFIVTVSERFKFIDDQLLRKECIAFLYEYIIRSEFDKLNYDNSLKYSSLLLGLNSKSKIAKEIIALSLHKKISMENNNEKALIEIESYYSRYSFLNGDKRIESARALMFGQLAIKEFAKSKPTEAMVYINKLSNLLDNHKDRIIINSQFYPFVYLGAGRYFYGKQKNKEAKELFEKGLIYSPNNEELKRMLKWSIEDMN